MNQAQMLQAVSILAPLLTVGAIAWNHLSRQMSSVEARVVAQNGRIGKLETNVMYRDTCTALHGQTEDILKRVEADVREMRQSLSRQVDT